AAQHVYGAAAARRPEAALRGEVARGGVDELRRRERGKVRRDRLAQDVQRQFNFLSIGALRGGVFKQPAPARGAGGGAARGGAGPRVAERRGGPIRWPPRCCCSSVKKRRARPAKRPGSLKTKTAVCERPTAG